MSIVLLFSGAPATQYLDDAGIVLSTITGIGSTGQTLIHEGHNPTSLDAIHDVVQVAAASGSITSNIPGQFPQADQTATGTGQVVSTLVGTPEAGLSVDATGTGCSTTGGTPAAGHDLQDAGCQPTTSVGAPAVDHAIDGLGISSGTLAGSGVTAHNVAASGLSVSTLAGTSDVWLVVDAQGSGLTISAGTGTVDTGGSVQYLDASGLLTAVTYGLAAIQSAGKGNGAWWPRFKRPRPPAPAQELFAEGAVLGTVPGLALVAAQDDDEAIALIMASLE